MIFNGDCESEPVSMVVSPKGTCFLLYHNNNKVLWSYDTNTRIYSEFHEKVDDYINANTDDDGYFHLYHCQSSSKSNIKKIQWMPNEEIHAYLKRHFGDEVIFRHSERLVDLNFEFGTLLDNSESNFVQIKMTDYMIAMSSPKWQLDFTRYEAVCFEKKNSFGVHCLVHHARSPREFTSLCKKLNCFQLSNGLTFEDVGLTYSLEMKRISRVSLAELKWENKSLDRDLELKGWFLGKYTSKVLAVIKKMDVSIGIAETYEKLWSLSNHDNIVKFLGAEVDGGDHSQLLFAFEFFSPIALPSFLDTLFSVSRPYVGLMRDVVDAVCHIHTSNHSHGSLNPWNILVSRDFKPKLCGIIKCKMLPERKSEERRRLLDEDLRQLGQLISYFFSYSTYRHRIKTEADYRVNRSSFYANIALNYREAADMADKLITNGSQQTFEYIYNHPWLWSVHKRLDFLRDASDYVTQLSKNSDYHLETEINKIDLDLKTTWKSKFKQGLITHMENYILKTQMQTSNISNVTSVRSPYNYWEVSSLLRFIRNLISHYGEIADELPKEDCLGQSHEELEQRLSTYFPKLLIGIYNILEINKPRNNKFKRYFS